MANKKINQPSIVTSWSNDLNLNDPGQPWDATPTKVLPGAGKRDDGWLPEEKPAAQHTNQLFHEIGQWIQYFSNKQPQNWPSKVTSFSVQHSANAVLWDEGDFAWISGGGFLVPGAITTVERAAADSDFVALAGGGTAGWFTWGATKKPAEVPTHVGRNTIFGDNGSATITELLTAGATNFVIPGVAPSTHHAMWDTANQLWIVGGIANAVPAFWSSATPVAAFALVTPTATNSNVVEMLATDPNTGFSVAIGDGAAFDVWTSADGLAWAETATAGITATETAKGIVWDESQSLFVMTTDKGCYTTADGVTFTKLVTFTTGSFALLCLATDGGGLLVSGEDGATTRTLRYSDDGGTTWRKYALDAAGGGLGTWQPSWVGYSRGRGKFVIAFGSDADNGDDGVLFYSISVATTPHEIDSITLPTVT